MVTTDAEQKRRRWHYWLTGGVAFVVIVTAALLLWFGFSQSWTGFNGSTTVIVETTDPQGNKVTTQIYQRTLWDWMGLLIVPVVLGVGVFWLNRSEQRRQAQIAVQRAEVERELALDRTREDRLQAYLDRMQDLLEKGLKSPPPESHILRNVARARTLTVLRGLDGERKSALLLFLYESELLHKDSPIVLLKYADLSKANLIGSNLSKSDLSGANLRRTDLSEADLSEANLGGSDLSESRLIGANLRGTDLSGVNLAEAGLSIANLRGAKLRGAYLSKVGLNAANLSEAVLTKADLSEADLIKADLSGADLSGADLSGAFLTGTEYDDETIWPDGFDPVAAGAMKVDQKLPAETSTDKSEQA